MISPGRGHVFLRVFFLFSLFAFPFITQAHTISEWLSPENLARLKRGEFSDDEEKTAWSKLDKSPEVLKKTIEYIHPEYLASRSLREGILKDILGPIEETQDTTTVDVTSALTLSLENLPGMATFLGHYEATAAEIETSIAERVSEMNETAEAISTTANEAAKQTSSDCPG